MFGQGELGVTELGSWGVVFASAYGVLRERGGMMEMKRWRKFVGCLVGRVHDSTITAAAAAEAVTNNSSLERGQSK